MMSRQVSLSYLGQLPPLFQCSGNTSALNTYPVRRARMNIMCRRLIEKTFSIAYDNLTSPNIIRVMKSRRLKWAGHVARMWEGREVHTVSQWGNLTEDDHLKDPGVDGRIILRRIFEK